MEKRTYQIGHSTLSLAFGDLTTSEADVLVSSDDAYISMGGGVSAAILRAGGESIIRDASKNVPARVGDVIVTTAGSLRAKHVFHAITIGEGTDIAAPAIVASATRRCLELVDVLRADSIAFPAIGAGVAGFAYQDVAVQMATVIVDLVKRNPRSIAVTIYLYDRFRRMQPLDFVAFFEEFAVRTHGLGPVVEETTPNHLHTEAGRPTTAKRPEQEQRGQLFEELGRLDRERQVIEARFAEYHGILAKEEVRRLEQRLREIHDERVEKLVAVTPRPVAQALSVFVSYAHADEILRKELGDHLSVLERQGLIATWHDRMIAAGTEWAGIIDQRLETSQVILLLVSSSFIASKYCYDVEMTRALERHDRNEALVIPVILRPVLLKGTRFAKLKALPNDARAVIEWPSRDSAFVDVAEGLKDAIQTLRLKPNG